jgi:hypothetical protein
MSKERLVELIGDAPIGVNGITLLDKHEPKVIEEVADYLIANGVIVPPCKVGSKVYWQNMGGKITEATVIKLLQARVDNGFEYDIPFEEIGKTIFLTREEIEAKLKEGKT